MEIGGRLRERRLELGFSRNQLAQKVGVTPSAIANYENGVSYPKPDILIALITELEVDANYLYQDYLSPRKLRTSFSLSMSAEEKAAVAKYRELSEDGKLLVRRVIDVEYERTMRDEWVTLPLLQPGVRKPHSGFLMRDRTQALKIKKKHIPKDTEFCFQIQVDQYRPVFQKYDVIALQKAEASHNEMGLFLLNGIFYIRTLSVERGSRRLRSLNVMDPDIEVAAADTFSCLGRILGKAYGMYEIDENRSAP